MARGPTAAKLILAVIAIGVAAIIALALYRYYSTVTVDWSTTKDVFDILQSAATIIAFGAGGVWAYFNFFKGRTYRSRLDPNVSGKITSRNGTYFLIVTAQLKNVGLSAVRIDQKGSALRVFAYTLGERPAKPRNVEQSRLITLLVFEDHGWIEPGELIEDQRLIAIPDSEQVALQIKLRLVSNKIEWNSAAIIEPPPPSDSASRSRTEGQRSLEAKDVRLSESGTPMDATVTSTNDVANITTKKREDAEESGRIEAEKTPQDVIKIEQQSTVTAEPMHEAQELEEGK